MIEAKRDKWAGSLNPSSADRSDTSRRPLHATEHPFNDAEMRRGADSPTASASER
jgi:hypothetical protein